MLSMQLESLQLQSCLGCWQMSQSQESGKSAGTQSSPFVPAGIGLMALSRVGTPHLVPFSSTSVSQDELAQLLPTGHAGPSLV